jgi:hypothetical protein
MYLFYRELQCLRSCLILKFIVKTKLEVTSFHGEFGLLKVRYIRWALKNLADADQKGMNTISILIIDEHSLI